MSDTTPTKQEITDALDVIERATGRQKVYRLSDIKKMSATEVAALPAEVLNGFIENDGAQS